MSSEDIKRIKDKALKKKPFVVKGPPHRRKAPYSGEPKDYVLNFGKHCGTKLSEVPVSYLQWILDMGKSFSRPDVLSIVQQYFGLPQESPVPTEAAKPLLGVEEGDILFEPYKLPDFQHSLKNATIGGRHLYEISLPELDDIVERTPDPKLKDFFVRRVVHFYKWIVYNFYRKALSIDISNLTPGEALQYQQVMDVCRRIQSVLDTVADPERAKDILRSPQFNCVFRMELPGLYS